MSKPIFINKDMDQNTASNSGISYIDLQKVLISAIVSYMKRGFL